MSSHDIIDRVIGRFDAGGAFTWKGTPMDEILEFLLYGLPAWVSMVVTIFVWLQGRRGK